MQLPRVEFSELDQHSYLNFSHRIKNKKCTGREDEQQGTYTELDKLGNKGNGPGKDE